MLSYHGLTSCSRIVLSLSFSRTMNSQIVCSYSLLSILEHGSGSNPGGSQQFSPMFISGSAAEKYIKRSDLLAEIIGSRNSLRAFAASGGSSIGHSFLVFRGRRHRDSCFGEHWEYLQGDLFALGGAYRPSQLF